MKEKKDKSREEKLLLALGEVDAALVAHYDGVGVGLQQVLKIGVSLEKLFGKRGSAPQP